MPRGVLTTFAAAAALAAAASAGTECTDNRDCSLAGECVRGACVCQPWAKGPDCAALNLVPERSPVAVASLVVPAADVTRWGGSVVRDPHNSSVHHAFVAEMAFGCGLSVWTDKSQVAHGISTAGPLGPFTRVGVAIPTEAHNPIVSRDPVDGTWLIWTCGCPHTPAHADCSKEAVVCAGGAEATWTTTVYSSQSLDGPWIPHVDLLGNITRGRLGSQNVSPLHHPDGSITLSFKGPDNNTETSIASAPSWRGPYTLDAVNIFAKYYAANITNEDVYMWRQPDGSIHALAHRMTPADREGALCGGHAFTENLTQPWGYALTPAYTLEVDLAGGGSFNVSRRERPQLLLDADTGMPTVLYNGVVKQSGGATFTFAQALKTSAPASEHP